MSDEFMTFYVFETFYMDLGLSTTIKPNLEKEKTSTHVHRSSSTPTLYETDFNNLDAENVFVQYI
ncbi:hypothetical protein HMI56_002442, partial [Coelomomyces lativittatus]